MWRSFRTQGTEETILGKDRTGGQETVTGELASAARGENGAARVVIVDDDKILCDLLRGRLDDEHGLECAGTAITPDEARRLVSRVRPLIILVDVRLGAGVDAINLVTDLVRLSPASQVLIWTTWTDPSPDRAEEFRQKVRASRAGATDWISKGDGINNLIDRIRAAVQRGPATPAHDVTNTPMDLLLGSFLGSPSAPDEDPGETSHADDLTPSEARAAGLAARGLERGMTVEQIAHARSMNTETLRTHLRRVYTKWGVHGQPAFVAEARRRGLC